MHRLEHLGRYELLEELGRGAMGVVYKARDPVIDRLAAVKVLATAPGLDPGKARQHRERFQREARAAGRLAHPNIVTIHDVGVACPASFPVIQKRKLFEDVAHHLRQLILSQTLKEGHRLPPERELAARFGVGRPSVREALRTLSPMGRVQIRAGEGAFVRRPGLPPFLKSMGDSLSVLIRQDASSLLELCDARRILEVETATVAAKRADAEDLVRLQAALVANEAARQTPTRFRSTDGEFHRAIAQATHNRILLFIHDALSDLMLRTREVALRIPGAAPDALASHRKICLAIQSRDRPGAAREMAIHLERVRGRLEKALGKRR